MPKVERTNFEALLDEAVAVARELAAAEMPKARTLNADAFIAEAKAMTGMPDKLVDEQLKVLAATINDGRLPSINGALNNIKRFISGGTGFTVTRPNLRIGGFLGERAEADLLAIGVAPTLMVAEAARRLAEDNPDAFGTCQDADAHDAHIADLRGRLGDLYRSIESGWSGADVVMDVDGLSEDDRRSGLARMRFRDCTDITVGPGCGKRLVDRIASWDEQVIRSQPTIAPQC